MNIEEFLKIPGEVSKEELELIASCLPMDDRSIIVELGCLYGRTSAMMASLTRGKVFSVDNFAINTSDTEPYFKKEILPKYPNITLLEGSTNKIAAEFFERIDFLFIDADHQDDSIQRDCKNWLPKVRSGGIVAFHDYFNYMFPSVIRRVEEVTGDWKSMGQVDRLMIKVKP